MAKKTSIPKAPPEDVAKALMMRALDDAFMACAQYNVGMAEAIAGMKKLEVSELSSMIEQAYMQYFRTTRTRKIDELLDDGGDEAEDEG
jgi:hypothetical protein